MTLVLTIIIFLVAIAMLALGVMLSRKPIKSGCCGTTELNNKCKADKETNKGA